MLGKCLAFDVLLFFLLNYSYDCLLFLDMIGRLPCCSQWLFTLKIKSEVVTRQVSIQKVWIIPKCLVFFLPNTSPKIRGLLMLRMHPKDWNRKHGCWRDLIHAGQFGCVYGSQNCLLAMAGIRISRITLECTLYGFIETSSETLDRCWQKISIEFFPHVTWDPLATMASLNQNIL
jgi:hypothetical protein